MSVRAGLRDISNGPGLPRPAGKRRNQKAQLVQCRPAPRDTDDSNLQAALVSAEAEVKRVFAKFQMAKSENKELRAQLERMEKHGGESAQLVTISLLQGDLERVSKENSQLRDYMAKCTEHATELEKRYDHEHQRVMKLAELLAASEMQLEAMERQGEKDRQEAKEALWKATADQQENHKKEVSLLDQQIQVLQTCVFEKMSHANKKTNEEIEQQAELLEDQDRQLEEYAEALKDRDQEITRLNGCIEKLESKLQSKNNALDVAAMEFGRLFEVLDYRKNDDSPLPHKPAFANNLSMAQAPSPISVEDLQQSIMHIAEAEDDEEEGILQRTMWLPVQIAKAESRFAAKSAAPQTLPGPTWDRVVDKHAGSGRRGGSKLDDPDYFVAV